jgi:hypothetical protein
MDLLALAIQLIAMVLFGIGIAEFLSLLKGAMVLRRIARDLRQNYSAVILKSPLVPAVSTIAVPPDASSESMKFGRRLLEMHFGRNEVVIVLDGPSESELAAWTDEFRLVPSARMAAGKLATAPVRGVYESRDPIRVVVIDKERGGLVDAWNAGVNACSSPVIGLLDPATDFQPEILLRMIQPMLDSIDETVALIAGLPVPPGPGLAARLGALESLRAWMTRGAAYSEDNQTMPFPGCAMLVRRNSVVQAGGFTGGPTELLLRLHGLGMAAGKPYRIAFLPDAICHNRTPAKLADLHRQLHRDQSDIAAAFFRRVWIAGPFGWRLMQGLFGVRAIRPWVETIGYGLAILGLVTRWVDFPTVLLLLLSTVGMGIVISMAAVVLREFAGSEIPDERRMAALFLAAIPENLGYRQLRNLWLIASFRPSGPPPVRPKA